MVTSRDRMNVAPVEAVFGSDGGKPPSGGLPTPDGAVPSERPVLQGPASVGASVPASEPGLIFDPPSLVIFRGGFEQYAPDPSDEEYEADLKRCRETHHAGRLFWFVVDGLEVATCSRCGIKMREVVE